MATHRTFRKKPNYELALEYEHALEMSEDLNMDIILQQLVLASALRIEREFKTVTCFICVENRTAMISLRAADDANYL